MARCLWRAVPWRGVGAVAVVGLVLLCIPVGSVPIVHPPRTLESGLLESRSTFETPAKFMSNLRDACFSQSLRACARPLVPSRPVSLVQYSRAGPPLNRAHCNQPPAGRVRGVDATRLDPSNLDNSPNQSHGRKGGGKEIAITIRCSRGCPR